MQRLLRETEPSKASLEELARFLAEDREPRPSDIGLRGEMTHYHAVFVRRDVEAPWGFARAWQRLDHARYLETLGALLDMQTGPRPRPAPEPPTPSRWLVLTGSVQFALSALPIDASTGRPAVYTREGTGFRLRAEALQGDTGQRAAALDWAVPR